MKGLEQGSLTARAKAQADESAKTLAALNAVMSAFVEELDSREKRRARAQESFVKLSALRRETLDALKDIVKNTDRLKKEAQRAKDSLTNIQRQESVTRGKYMEILSGRIPMANGEETEGVFETLFHKESEELSARKDQFMSRLTNVFSSLESDIREIEIRSRELRETITDCENKLGAFERKRVILFQKLEIYKSESAEMERAVKATEEEEEKLLRDYAEFTRRLKPLLALSPSTEKMLEKSLRK